MPKELKRKFANIFLALPHWARRILSACHVGRHILALRDALYISEDLKYFPPAARELRIRYLLRDFIGGRPIGSNIPGFFPFMAKNYIWTDFPDFEYRANKAPDETVFDVINPSCRMPQSHKISLALHIHAYYLDGIIDIKNLILLNKNLPDIFVTGPNVNKKFILDLFRDYPKNFTFYPCENIGRDIVPFLQVLAKLTDNYDLIGHIHVKKSLDQCSTDFANSWSTYLLESVIGTSDGDGCAIDSIVNDFENRSPRPALYIPDMTDFLGWGANLSHALNLAPKFGLTDLPDKFLFSTGTMFWGSAAYLSSFQNINLDWNELASEPLPHDGTILHAIERLFGAVAVAHKEKIVIVSASEKPFVLSEKVMKLCALQDRQGLAR